MEKNTTIKVGDSLVYKNNLCYVTEVHDTYASIQTRDRDPVLLIRPKYIIPLYKHELIPIDYSKEIIND